MRMEYLLTPIQKETAGSDKSKQPEPKESQPPEAAHKLEEEQPNIKQKTTRRKRTKASVNQIRQQDIAEKSGDPKRDGSNGARRTTSAPQVSKPHSRCFAHHSQICTGFSAKIRLTPVNRSAYLTPDEPKSLETLRIARGRFRLTVVAPPDLNQEAKSFAVSV